jgi:hypothetical protein
VGCATFYAARNLLSRCRRLVLPRTFDLCLVHESKANNKVAEHVSPRGFTHGASGSPQRCQASHRSGCSRCRAGRRCTAAPWLFHSNTSSSGCTRSRVQRCRTASRSVPWISAHLWRHTSISTVLQDIWTHHGRDLTPYILVDMHHRLDGICCRPQDYSTRCPNHGQRPLTNVGT